jgi:hypothetical protein
MVSTEVLGTGVANADGRDDVEHIEGLAEAVHVEMWP